MKIRPLGVESFISDGRSERQTDITKLTVTFQKLATATNIGKTNLLTSHEDTVAEWRYISIP